MMNTGRETLARGLARALLADARGRHATRADALAARMAAALGQRPPWLQPLADEAARWSQATWQGLDVAALAARLLAMPGFGEVGANGAPPHVVRQILRPERMHPPPLGLDRCGLPVFTGASDLAHWLGIDADRLAWLAGDAARFRGPPPKGGHYRHHLVAKRDGGVRLIEAPRDELRRAQRRLLDGLLAHVPAHEAAHGFVAGRGVASHAALHLGRETVLALDLADFFPCVPASRIHALWRTLGYPDGVARSLTTLTTARTPPSLLERLRREGRMSWLQAKRYAAPHLPQGAPTSPGLANLCCFGLDLRLAGLAESFDASYSRYADDLVFSGNRTLGARRGALIAWVAGIAADEGFALNRDKLRCMPRHRRQTVTGVVVNRALGVPRAAFDRLKAVLHLCRTRGPSTQCHGDAATLRERLRGQVAWVAHLHPRRGARLRALFDAIDWSR